MTALGVIPARGGSKTIPMKNVRQLCGKPLIFYSIEAARQSRHLSRLVVSTDNEKISRIAGKEGCEVIIRPGELASDASPTEDTLIHSVNFLQEKYGFNPDIVVTLEPTSPLRSPELIDRCVELFKNKEIDSVIGVVETKDNICNIVNGRFKFLCANQPRRRQERDSFYKESSTIYATRTEVLLKQHSVFGNTLCPIVVDASEAIDINTELDFIIAEAVMKQKAVKK